MPLGQHHDRSVGESDLQISILLDHFPRTCNVGGAKRLKLVCATRDLLQQRRLRAPANVANQQLIELGQYEGGKQQRR